LLPGRRDPRRNWLIRRPRSLHGLLSYVFGTGIMAVAINAVTNLGQA
jgi:uncharacterized membrane protein